MLIVLKISHYTMIQHSINTNFKVKIFMRYITLLNIKEAFYTYFFYHVHVLETFLRLFFLANIIHHIFSRVMISSLNLIYPKSNLFQYKFGRKSSIIQSYFLYQPTNNVSQPNPRQSTYVFLVFTKTNIPPPIATFHTNQNSSSLSLSTLCMIK